MQAKKAPIRMCIHCKERFNKYDLLRFQCNNQTIIKFSGVGRSFYICKSCIYDKNIGVSIAKVCKKSKKDGESYLEGLKEILFNG